MEFALLPGNNEPRIRDQTVLVYHPFLGHPYVASSRSNPAAPQPQPENIMTPSIRLFLRCGQDSN